MPESRDTSSPEDNNHSQSRDESGDNELPVNDDRAPASDDSGGDSSEADRSGDSADADPDDEVSSVSEPDSSDEPPTEATSDEPDIENSDNPATSEDVSQEDAPLDGSPQDTTPPTEAPTNGPFMPTAPYLPKRPPVLVRGWRTFRGRYARDKGASVALTVIALVLVIIASVIVWRVSLPPKPVQAVDEYLSALQDGEINEALQLTYVNNSERENNPFIASELMSTDWEVDNLELIHEGAGTRSGSNEATVEATIAAPNGTTVTSEIELAEVGDEWRVDNPLVHVTVDERLAPYITVNEHTLEDFGSFLGTHTLSMPPGIYSFDVEAEGIFESTSASFIGIGDEVKLLDEDSGNFTKSEDEEEINHLTFNVDIHSSAQDLAQQKVDELVADCYSNLTADRFASSNNCPFTYDRRELLELAGVEYEVLMSWDELTWTNYEAPEVSLSWDNNEHEGFVLRASAEGFFEVSGVTNERAGSVEADFMCTFGAGELNALVRDDEVAVETTNYRDSDTKCRLLEDR